MYAEVGCKDVGTKRVAEIASKMGIRTPLSKNPAMVLGGLRVGLTPLELGHSYVTLAHGGKRVSGSLAAYDNGPVAYTSVEGSGIDDHNDTETKRVVSEGVAQQATQILQTVVSSGTGKGRSDRRVRRRQDRDHRALSGRTVRRFHQHPHGGGLGRLSHRGQGDGVRIPRRARRRRYLPRRDLARFHAARAKDPRCAGARDARPTRERRHRRLWSRPARRVTPHRKPRPRPSGSRETLPSNSLNERLRMEGASRRLPSPSPSHPFRAHPHPSLPREAAEVLAVAEGRAAPRSPSDPPALRGCLMTPRVRLASAGSSGARTQGGAIAVLLRRPRTPPGVDPPPPGVRGGVVRRPLKPPGAAAKRNGCRRRRNARADRRRA